MQCLRRVAARARARFKLPVSRTSLVLILSTLAACSNPKDVTGPSAMPAAIRASMGGSQTGTVGAALAVPLSVLVTDSDGNPVSGARVGWDAAAGSGSFSPTTVTTDNRGVATSTWTLGTVAGTVRATAQVGGINPVTFTATALAGAAASVVALPEAAGLGVGDTVRIRATVRDQYSNDVGGQAITYESLAPAVATVSTDGLVTAVSLGTSRIVVTSAARADTVPVLVSTAGVCGTATSRMLALGEVFVPTAGASISACLTAPGGASADYALAMISTASGYATVTPLDVYAIGNSSPTIALLTVGERAAVDMPASAPRADDAVRLAELARRETERRELDPLVSAARQWQASRGLTASLQTAADARVGDIIRLNGNANLGCTNPDTRVGRVAAVGTRAIVVADTANPSGGYSDAEYASIVATFDTLVYPLDTAAFGVPSNISTYGKITLFYTRTVNAQTPPSAGYTIGGFFFARDLYPRTARGTLGACPASNEQEMFYLLVPDPTGTINSNRRTKDQVTALNLGTIAHEFQHLINSSRRLYITPNAAASEETWLDEGLSHIAEELLFFRVSGFSSRQNLTLANVASQSSNFTNYASQNFARFYSFLISPETNSPYAPNDSLATRGATWNFLRFVAGRQGEAGEYAFFRALVNSTTTGLSNLNTVTGGQLGDYLRDWTVSVIADDYSTAESAALGPQYNLLAWNFRNIYPGLRFSGGSALGSYPIAARALSSNVSQRVSLVGGASSYARFSIGSGRTALVSVSSNGGPVPASLRYAIVRLR